MVFHLRSEQFEVDAAKLSIPLTQVAPHPAHVTQFVFVSQRVLQDVWVSISEEFVEHVAELPAEHSVAGEGQPVDDRPKGLCPFLMVGAQYAW